MTFAAAAASSSERSVTAVWQKPAQRPPDCSKEEYDQLPKTLTLRTGRFNITVPGFRSKRSDSRHHLARCRSLSGPGTGKSLFRRWNVELQFPTDIRNHAGHGVSWLPHLRDGSQRAGDASDRLQSHSRRDAVSRYNLRCRLGANFLQRLSLDSPPPSLRRRHLAPPTASLANRPSSSTLALARLPPIWSRCARTQPTSRSVKRRPKDVSAHEPNLVKKCSTTFTPHRAGRER